MIQVYTGNGKGKTTAAIGQAVRAVGQNKKVLVIQFIKGHKWLSGEEKAAKEFGSFFVIKKFGIGFIVSDDITKHKESAEKGWEYAKEQIESGKWDVIILDEINVAANLKLLKEKDIAGFLKNYKDKQLFILTGRGAPESFIEIADLVTEMKEIKHYYSKGVTAIKGIEY